MIHVIAPFREGDIVLRRSRWIAALNVENLRRRNHTVRHLQGFDPEPDVRGFAFFGHGNEEYLQDAKDGNLVPAAATPALAGRWFHAFACKGTAFGEAAIKAGATVFVGYDSWLRPRWSEDDIPEDARPLVERVFTIATETLASGRAAELLPALRSAVDDVVEWFDDHGQVGGDLRNLCEQLYDDVFILPFAPGAPRRALVPRPRLDHP